MTDQPGGSDHYLKRELYDRVQADPTLFEFLQAGSLDGIWYWDLTDDAQEWMSPRFWKVLGVDPSTKQHRASEWQHLLHPDDLPAVLANFEAHCADPNHPYDQVVRYEHASGSTVWIRCRGLVIRDDNGVPIRMLGAHTDVTELKRLQVQTAKAALELKASNDELERFAYVASHDLLQPLRTIKGYVDLLKHRIRDDLGDKERQYMQHISDGVLHMQQLIDELLGLARVGHDGLKLVAVDMAEIAQDATRLLSAAIEQAGASVRLGELPTVVADRMLLLRLVQNLIDNAIKYGKSGSPARVEVFGAPCDGGWTLSVRDDGIGIDPKHHERIFDVFRQLPGPAAQAPGAHGVGLATCRKIARLHGGDIRVESTPGEGSTFTVTLPSRKA